MKGSLFCKKKKKKKKKGMLIYVIQWYGMVIIIIVFQDNYNFAEDDQMGDNNIGCVRTKYWKYNW